MSKYPLVPVERLRRVKGDLYARIRREAAAISLNLSFLEDNEVGEALAWSFLFERWPQMLPGPPVDQEAAFYNQYFWTKRHATLIKNRDGENDGLEQRVGNLLVAPEFGLDWEVINHLYYDASSV